MLATWRTADVWDTAGHDWGYIAVNKGLLYGTVTHKGASRTGHSRQQINETYYDDVSIVTSRGLFCLDRQTGERSWSYQPRGGIVNPTITIGDGRMYFVESRNANTLDAKSGRSPLKELLGEGADLVALDAQTGKTLWRQPANSRDVQHHLFLCYAKGKLISIGTRNRRQADGKAYVWYDVACFDARTGRPQWKKSQNQRQRSGGSHGEQDHHPVVVGDTVYVEPYAYRLETGEQRQEWRLMRNGHGCGTMSASASTFFFRASNPTMADIATGRLRRVTTVSRPGCWINMIPAGGVLLIPEASSGCTCNFSIQCSMAFWPVRATPKSK